ncbi:MAG: hypothetical protein IPM34_12045 [Saprospiraceae bacterium]|nr:hypothetical protein [Saprospiraceae bacterium]
MSIFVHPKLRVMEQTVQSLKDLRKGVFNERSKDLLLAVLIAIIGLTGSYLVLGKSFRNTQNLIAPSQEFTPYSNAANTWQNSRELQDQNTVYQFKAENLLVQGSMLVGGFIRITNLAFNPDQIYLIDYGNGIRHRMTSSVMSIRYNVPGLYLLQCYVQENGNWNLQSAVTVSIRKPQKHESGRF